ncbi:AAA family ATPase [Peribacillus kribbensis]|uniref:AAA family ATPase n=1 Tax=Peribacillus kribbensis TaxID=356658 RepID=UPI00041A8D33|nr:AAA family ATPase [Peribacillus kribbensis]
MKFILLFGPQAVGKMTVGQELEKITELKLFHNHMTIDLLQPLFGFTPEMWQLCHSFRESVFKTYSSTSQYGMIFTFVWAFDQKGDWRYVKKITNIFRSKGAEIYYVELEADIEERLLRNKTPHRLQHKPTKRNIGESEGHLLSTMERLRLNSNPGEIKEEHYIRINNTRLSAEETAQRIKEAFQL